MRGFASIAASVCLASALLFAPFQHVHDPGRAVQHVAKYHHGGLALHLHIAGLEKGDASWKAADDSAHLLQWFRASEVKAHTFTVAVVSTPIRIGFDAKYSPRRLTDETQVGESPPLVRPSPRGPPV